MEKTALTEEKLSYIKNELEEIRSFDHGARIIEYDLVTVCPEGGREASGDIAVFLNELAFRKQTDPQFTEAVTFLYEKGSELSDLDQVLIRRLYREVLHNKNISPVLASENEKIKKQAWTTWVKAKREKDFSVFSDMLDAVLKSEIKRVSLWEPMEDELDFSTYDRLISEYEFGLRSEVLDQLFLDTRNNLVTLIKEKQSKSKQIRTDFLSRPVTDEQQRKISEYILEVMGFDKNRGTMGLTEHPFTNLLTKDDVRVTTKFEEQNFLGNIYTTLHEGGHALFEQYQPKKSYDHFIEDQKTMGMHESVSRFYENIIGRSEAFIHFIYPKLREVFPQVMEDVTERELYEAVNRIEPSLIRMDADEVTYTLHIVIRYEIEKELVNGTVSAKDVPKLWNEKYREYLGVVPKNDAEGALQDNHWTENFGYFPTYAIGNFYNAMYLKEMQKEFDPFAAVAEGDFIKIRNWMAQHVFLHADTLPADKWIHEITGRNLCADDFLSYLECKMTEIYG